jgi:membrane-associated phospholipid phosphatase
VTHTTPAAPPLKVRLLALLLTTVLASAAFLFLATQVSGDSAVARFDLSVTKSLAESASPAGRQVVGAITWFGNAEVFGALAAILGLTLIVKRYYVAAAWWIIAQVGGSFLVLTLKALIGRSRPEFAYVNEVARGWSFPSGHALRTAVLCGMLAYIVFRTSGTRRTAAVVAIGALVWSLLMAFTRVYLGAHYVSDVTASLLAGAAWVAICAAGLEVGLSRERRP